MPSKPSLSSTVESQIAYAPARDSRDLSIIARAARYIDLGMNRRDALQKRLSYKELERIVAAICELAEGVAYEKEYPRPDGSTYKRIYVSKPDAKAARLIFEIAGVFPEGASNLSAALAKARRELSSSDLIAYQQKFIDAQTERAITETKAYLTTIVEPVTIHDGISQLVVSLVAFLQSIPREEMETEYCPDNDHYQKFHARFGQYADRRVAEVLAMLDAKSLPAAIAAAADEEE